MWTQAKMKLAFGRQDSSGEVHGTAVVHQVINFSFLTKEKLNMKDSRVSDRS